jgi:hypothetical protein
MMRRCALWCCELLLHVSLTCSTLALIGIRKWAPVMRETQQRYEPTAITDQQLYIPTAEEVAFAMLVEQHGEHGIYVVQDADVADTAKARAMAYKL